MASTGEPGAESTEGPDPVLPYHQEVSFRFLSSPRWIAGIVIAVASILLFCLLGMWQLRRLEERQTLNSMIEERSASPSVDLSALASQPGAAPGDLEWRRVTATGMYDAAAQVILEGRSHLNAAGSNVLTPLVLGDGTAVVVNRGWIAIDALPPSPPTGSVTVAGVLRPDEGSGVLGGGSGPVTRIGSIDLRRLAAQIDANLLPVYLQLESQVPDMGDQLLPVPLPESSEGPHLAYAIQWFLFAVIVLIGFPALVVRTARISVSRRTPSTPSSVP
jgi:cytochrome oxidase assembly protein ShyY1